jgi:dolichol kinase
MVLLIALVATALEQVAWLGLDNLTVPIVSAWLWSCWR